MTIEERFKEAKKIPDIVRILKELKEEGVDPTEANNYANKRKRELIAAVNTNIPHKLVKLVPEPSLSGGQTTMHLLEPVNLCSGVVRVNFEENKISI